MSGLTGNKGFYPQLQNLIIQMLLNLKKYSAGKLYLCKIKKTL